MDIQILWLVGLANTLTILLIAYAIVSSRRRYRSLRKSEEADMKIIESKMKKKK